ncbi:MAG: excinuclease ABC subunit UvrC [Actinomycetes bacterium]
MADPSTYRPAPGTIPEAPGVYRFRDERGVVIYVGKAKSLRSRLASYFADLSGLHPRTRSMVQAASSVDWVTVGTEVEALQLEYTWIKEFDPRFNVRYRDDKSYPYLVVTVDERIPRAYVSRDAKKRGAKYFGPFAHAWAIRETLDLILRVFPIRTCSTGVYRRAERMGRPCLLGYIDKCSAPCVGRVTPEEHREIVSEFTTFMGGQTQIIERRLQQRMRAASAEQDYEQAARLRDDLGALARATERNAVVLPDGTQADIIALCEDELEAAVEVFHVRHGRVTGQRSLIVEKVEDLDTAGLLTRLIQQLYTDQTAVPPRVLISAMPEAASVAYLSEIRRAPVAVSVPQRGAKKALMDTVAGNAQQALHLHKLKRAGDLTTRSLALTQIQQMLDLPVAPLRIECVDVSHLGGQDVVASLVVFEDGAPRTKDYRSYRLSPEGSRDDTSAIEEVVYRRFRRMVQGDQDEQDIQDSSAATPVPQRFAYPPQLLLIDGGAPQVAAAQRAIDRLDMALVPIAGLAKRLEEVWIPGQSDPVILPRASEGLFLLQRIRDEAHRTAIRHQRQTRKKRTTTSRLDAVPGLGPQRQQDLLKAFGSVKKLQGATAAELQSVSGIGPALAELIVSELSAQSASSSSTPLESQKMPTGGFSPSTASQDDRNDSA